MLNVNYELGAKLRIVCSGESGEAIGRCEYTYSEPTYLLRYVNKDGNAVEQWWPQSALAESPPETGIRVQIEAKAG
jgi:hypothetical protein